MPRGSRSKNKQSPSAAASTSSTPSESMLINPSDGDAIYFFKPKQEHGFLSQWYPSVFTLEEPDGSKFTYENAEQFMMHRKGILFAPDSPITSAILETTNPRDIKALGRKVPNFDDVVWKQERMKIVTEGTYLKFTQNEDLKMQLLRTFERELVEASPFDRIWGVGFGAERAPKMRNKWGANLLGQVLMNVRKRIRLEEEGEAPAVDDE